MDLLLKYLFCALGKESPRNTLDVMAVVRGDQHYRETKSYMLFRNLVSLSILQASSCDQFQLRFEQTSS